MDARLRDHECDRRIKFADVRGGGNRAGCEGSSRKDIARARITRSSRFVRVEGNEVSRLHRQTRSTGNGSLASSIKRVTYRGGKNSRGAAASEKLTASKSAVAAIAGCTRRSRNRVSRVSSKLRGTRVNLNYCPEKRTRYAPDAPSTRANSLRAERFSLWRTSRRN